MHKLAQSVLAYIREQDLIRPGHRVGIAVSGGADSVALLHLMLELKGELGIVLSAVHVNHQLRGAESDVDEQFVGKLAQANSLELFSESRDVRGFASENKLSVEAAARRLRYHCFEKLLLEGTLNEVATAHTLDDQAETVLLKLARGAGTRGLAGIYPKLAVSHQPSAIRNDSANRVAHPSAVLGRGEPPRDARRTAHDDVAAIIRPVLTTRGSTLRDYLADLHQPWREDCSNRDLRHTRNRVRHGILPRFERHVNPSIRETLADAAEIARAEESYWQDQIANLLPQLWQNDAEGATVDSERLKTFPLAVRRRLLRAAAELLGLNLEFRHIEEILTLDRGGRAALPNGWVASLQNNQLRFHKQRESPAGYAYEFVVPGEIYLPAAGITIQAIAANGNSTNSASSDLLDERFARQPLTLRNWRPGERFWPAHTKAPRKIKELLQDHHVTGEEKKLWPVLAFGDEIVWLRGFGVRRDCIAKGSERILIREFPTK